MKIKKDTVTYQLNKFLKEHAELAEDGIISPLGRLETLKLECFAQWCDNSISDDEGKTGRYRGEQDNFQHGVKKAMGKNRYELHIYAGTKPDNIDKPPSGRRLLLCRGIMGKIAQVVAEGTASFFIIFKNGKAIGSGDTGVSGCALVLSNITLKKDGFCVLNGW